MSTSVARHQMLPAASFWALESSILLVAIPPPGGNCVLGNQRERPHPPKKHLLSRVLCTSLDHLAITFFLGSMSDCTLMSLRLSSKVNCLRPWIIFIGLWWFSLIRWHLSARELLHSSPSFNTLPWLGIYAAHRVGDASSPAPHRCLKLTRTVPWRPANLLLAHAQWLLWFFF